MTFKQIQEALAARSGGQAKVWGYRVSHKWLVIRLTAPQLAGNFHLSCGDCERVEFDAAWFGAAVQVEQAEDGFLVHDGAHLRVECGIVEGAFNVEPCFGAA